METAPFPRTTNNPDRACTIIIITRYLWVNSHALSCRYRASSYYSFVFFAATAIPSLARFALSSTSNPNLPIAINWRVYEYTIRVSSKQGEQEVLHHRSINEYPPPPGHFIVMKCNLKDPRPPRPTKEQPTDEKRKGRTDRCPVSHLFGSSFYSQHRQIVKPQNVTGADCTPKKLPPQTRFGPSTLKGRSSW